ncbi:MAG: hypothetical protein QHH07_12825 [Sedimentisphaerales bacterium]|nr:hypothetical protein [Sedimentisphaerales bacterium]
MNRVSKPVSRIAEAIKHLRETGDVEGAVRIAIGQLTEEFVSVQTQQWYCPNENAVNQLVLLVQNRLGIRVSDISQYSTGSTGGYVVTFTGEMGDSDIATLASRLGCYPIAGAHLPGALT